MKKIAKPMRIITHNYWGVRRPHIITKWLDTDHDGVPDYKDCKPLNPNKQDDPWEEEWNKKSSDVPFDSLDSSIQKRLKMDWERKRLKEKQKFVKENWEDFDPKFQDAVLSESRKRLRKYE